MLTFIIVLLIVGLVAGAIARLLVPGRDPGSERQTPPGKHERGCRLLRHPRCR